MAFPWECAIERVENDVIIIKGPVDLELKKRIPDADKFRPSIKLSGSAPILKLDPNHPEKTTLARDMSDDQLMDWAMSCIFTKVVQNPGDFAIKEDNRCL